MEFAHLHCPYSDNGICRTSMCRLWTPIDGEFDDYIINPKPSGYQVIFSLLVHYKEYVSQVIISLCIMYVYE